MHSCDIPHVQELIEIHACHIMWKNLAVVYQN